MSASGLVLNGQPVGDREVRIEHYEHYEQHVHQEPESLSTTAIRGVTMGASFATGAGLIAFIAKKVFVAAQVATKAATVTAPAGPFASLAAGTVSGVAAFVFA